ncbi:MAG TPA: hypothetical protein GXZ95_03685 [Mollicutes bacterium]|nr:hypothetical protein [Mollicutes bacterium]
MKNKKIITLFIITITLVNLWTSLTFAGSVYNNGLKFIGEVITTKKYYDGDILLRDDVILNGYCKDENNNIIDINTKNIYIPNTADLKNREYVIYDNGKNCSGVIDIDIKPFDSTVNYDEFIIPQVSFNKDNNIKDIRQSAKVYLWSKIEEVNFYNNIGNKLDVNYEKSIVDIYEIQSEEGIYTVPYEIGFYTKNLKKDNIYDVVKGTFEVAIGDGSVIEKNTNLLTENILSKTASLKEVDTITPTLNATNLILGLDTTFDINVNNKISGSKYTWQSFNPKVAKVNAKNGVITPVGNGETIIMCKILLPDESELFLECKVIVGYDEDSPILSDDSLELNIGDVFRLKVNNTIIDSEYSWKSSDKTIAKVTSKTGKITAIASGEAYITCTITIPETNQKVVLRCDVSVSE